MSRVILIAADRPLPLCDRQEERTSTVTTDGFSVSVTGLRGFRVSEHTYYRCAVDELGYPMKAHQHELELEPCQTDLAHLRTYLSANLNPGEEAELWNLWLGTECEAPPVHFRGALADFDLDTLDQFLNLPTKDGLLGQCCMTVTI